MKEIGTPLFAKEWDDEKVSKHIETVEKILGKLDAKLAPHPGKFFAGTDKPTIADFVVFGEITVLHMARTDELIAECSKVQAWFNRMLELDCVKTSHDLFLKIGLPEMMECYEK